MNTMPIYSPDGNVIYDGLYTDDSERYKKIMGENTLTLKFSSVEYIDFPVGSYVLFKRDDSEQGEYYFLFDTAKLTKNHSFNWEYDITFESEQSLLKTRIFKFFTVRNDGQTEPARDSIYKTKSWYYGTPYDFLQLMVMSMNDGDSGWDIGSYPETEAKNIDFSNENCLEMLQKVADVFDTEWEVIGKQISLGKIERQKDNPLELSYGKGKGLLPGIVRSKGNTARFNRLLIQGGERNLSIERYGNDTLLFPKNAILTYEGVQFRSDTYGKYIEKFTQSPAERIVESVIDLSEIYPMREGTLTGVETFLDGEVTKYRIFDASLTEEGLNYTDTFIDGTKPTLVFHKGDLTGQEFDIESYNNDTASFVLTPLSTGGMTLPNETLAPKIGDVYAVFNIKLPQSYIADAENRAMQKGVENLYEGLKQKLSVDTELDQIYAKENWENIKSHLSLGYFIRFYDESLMPDPENIRIVGIRELVNFPKKPKIELNNEITKDNWSSLKNTVKNTEVETIRQTTSAYNLTERRYRDVVELSSALDDAFDNFSDSINPRSVNAMQIYLGDERLQYKFVTNRTNPIETGHGFLYSSSTKRFSSPAGIIQHMTLGIDTLKPVHSANEFSFWDIESFLSDILNDEIPYWVYLKCSKTTESGLFELRTEPIDFETATDYNLIVGYLNSAYNGERSFTTMYGFSEWTAGMLRVNAMASTDGSQYIDWLNKKTYFGNENSGYSFDVDVPGSFVVRGGLVQSPSGDMAVIGVWRGDYSPATQYYVGDELYYSGSTYRCIVQPPDIGVSPTNTTYFKVSAAKGDPGSHGSTGSTGPGIVFRGDYAVLQDKGETIFYNNSTRRDVVYYNSNYYVYNGTNGQNNATWVASRWQTFGAQFSSVATNLLLAEYANVGGWIFQNERLESQSGGAFLDGRTGSVSIKGEFRTGDTGESRFVMSYGNLFFYNENDKILLDVRLDGTVPNLFLRPTSGNGYFRMTPYYAEITGANGKTLVTGWYGNRLSLGPADVSDWPTSANGGYIWRDSAGVLHAG